MKKIILITGLFLGLVFSAQSQTKAGVHFGYGSEIDRPAIGANAEFGITDKISIAPDFTYFFTENLIYVKTTLCKNNSLGIKRKCSLLFYGTEQVQIFWIGRNQLRFCIS